MNKSYKTIQMMEVEYAVLFLVLTTDRCPWQVFEINRVKFSYTITIPRTRAMIFIYANRRQIVYIHLLGYSQRIHTVHQSYYCIDDSHELLHQSVSKLISECIIIIIVDGVIIIRYKLYYHMSIITNITTICYCLFIIILTIMYFCSYHYHHYRL